MKVYSSVFFVFLDPLITINQQKVDILHVRDKLVIARLPRTV